MITAISIWFKALSNKMKILTVVIALILIALSIQSARLARSEYLRLKAIEKEYNDAIELVKQSEENELDIIKKNNSTTKKVSSKNRSINKKLKDNEEIIDSDSITNNERQRFISKYENQ